LRFAATGVILKQSPNLKCSKGPRHIIPTELPADSIAVLIGNNLLEDIILIKLQAVNWTKVTSQSDLEMIK
jgi:hypothetical protein